MTRAPLRRVVIAALAALGVFACGGAETTSSGTGAFDFGVTISRAVANQATQFQVALIANGSKYDCATLQNTCLSTAGVKDADFVRLTDSSGAQHKVLTFANALADGGSTQDVSLSDLSPGKDFAVVVEAIAPGQLLGSSCNYLPEIRSGANPPVLAVVQPLDGGTPCNPAIP